MKFRLQIVQLNDIDTFTYSLFLNGEVNASFPCFGEVMFSTVRLDLLGVVVLGAAFAQSKLSCIGGLNESTTETDDSAALFCTDTVSRKEPGAVSTAADLLDSDSGGRLILLKASR